MRTAYELVSEELQCAFGRAKIRYDSRVKAIRFEVGQYVLYTNPAAKPQLTQKWILQTTGPHLIVQKLNNVNYRIQLKPAGRVMTVHIDRLVRYEGEISAKWRRFAERLIPADTQGSSNPVVAGPPAGNPFPAAEASAPAGNSFAPPSIRQVRSWTLMCLRETHFPQRLRLLGRSVSTDHPHAISSYRQLIGSIVGPLPSHRLTHFQQPGQISS